MRRQSPDFARLSRSLSVVAAGVMWACASTAMAAPAPAPAPASQASSTEVSAPAGTPIVVVNNTTTTTPAPAAAPAVVAPVPVAAPVATAPVATAPATPAAAPTIPARISVDLTPHPMAPPSKAEWLRLQRVSEMSRARSLRAAGWATLGGTYGFSALIGTIALDSAGSNRGRRYGAWMTLPVAGPFVSAFHTRTATGALVTTSLGVAQAAGLAMALIGGSRYRRLKRQLSLAAAPTRDGGRVAFSMRF